MSEELPQPGGTLAAGARLAGYRVEAEIARGGMAVVYRASDDRLGRPVALKVLAPELARDEVFRARFMQESRIAAGTEHPNIIPVFNAGEADGALYLAMRYVPDGDLRALLDRDGPLPAARACALISQAASALDAAHARGLVHRDVKPTNILLELSARSSRPDHLYLADFGLAKPSSAAGLTTTGQFFGTVDYVAPEQIHRQPLDGRTDQYALACTSFEMLCGSPPFRRATSMAIISAHVSEPPPSLAARCPGLPAAVDQVIAKAMAKTPAGRYERCGDFAEALLAACQPAAAAAGPDEHAAVTVYPPPRIAGGTPPTATVVDAAAPTGPAAPAGPATLAAPAAPAGPGGRGRRRSWLTRAGGVVAILVALFAASAGVTYLVALRGQGGQPQAAATTTGPAAPHSSVSALAGTGPAATVQAYYTAINEGRYQLAWQLGGRNTGSSHQAFVSGYSGTVHDSVTILSVSGDTVTARVAAEQADGTIKTYQGTYTVTSGVITHFSVRRVS